MLVLSANLVAFSATFENVFGKASLSRGAPRYPRVSAAAKAKSGNTPRNRTSAASRSADEHQTKVIRTIHSLMWTTEQTAKPASLSSKLYSIRRFGTCSLKDRCSKQKNEIRSSWFLWMNFNFLRKNGCFDKLMEVHHPKPMNCASIKDLVSILILGLYREVWNDLEKSSNYRVQTSWQPLLFHSSIQTAQINYWTSTCSSGWPDGIIL